MRPYYEAEGITLYNADWQDVLPTLEVDSQWLTVTDPPYGTGGWRRLVSGNGSKPAGSLVREDWDTGSVTWLQSVRTDVVMTFWPAGGAYSLLAEANRIGLAKHRCLYMRKPDPKPLPGGRTRWSVEPIWVLSGEGFVLRGNNDDVYEHSTPRLGQPGATGHPYQKPLKVMLWLLAKAHRTMVLDPFAGSGTTLVAAKQLGRRAVGVEQSEQWCEVAARRLSQGVLALEASR